MEQILKQLIMTPDMVKSMSEQPGGGRADDVDAKLSENEFVFPAWAVTQLGGGSTEAGVEFLNQLLERLKNGNS